MGKTANVKLKIGDNGNCQVSAMQIGKALRMNPEALAEVLLAFANGSGRSQTLSDKLAATIASDHPTLQQILIGIMLRTLYAYGKNHDHWDARNEAAHDVCTRFAKAVDEGEFDIGLPLI